MFRPGRHFLPAAVWGVLQLCVLGVGVSGFPLWGHHPFPRESLALDELLIAQAIIVATLFPLLLATPLDVLIVLALMIPLDQLAGLLAGSPQSAVWTGVGCLVLWLAGFAAWAIILKEHAWQIIIAGMATMLLAGGGIYDYLTWEAAASNGQGSAFLPISLLPRLCLSIHLHSAPPWVQASTSCIAAATTVAVREVLRQRKRPSTFLHRIV